MIKLKNLPDRPGILYGHRIDGVFSVTGTVHVIRDQAELPFFREGEILVAQAVDQSWVEQLRLAKGLIEDASAGQSLVETIASQYDLPSVIEVTGALESLRSGDIVTLHADGKVERMMERREPDSPMRVSVPAAVAARNHNGGITSADVVTDPANPEDESGEGTDQNTGQNMAPERSENTNSTDDSDSKLGK